MIEGQPMPPLEVKFHLDLLIEDCEHCVKQYMEKPGLVTFETTLDLYRAIARLARIIKAQS